MSFSMWQKLTAPITQKVVPAADAAGVWAGAAAAELEDGLMGRV
jgi:hypothetical protein